MKIGLIDVDGHNYPNLPLMKLSAYHKKQGDTVEWYDPMFSEHMDKVYMSKVFSFTEDYPWYVDAGEIIKGGTGYCISLVDGKEVFDKTKDIDLPYEIEHIYPDYDLYGIKYSIGFLTRGCPRGCDFCHVKDKEGTCSVKVADLSEFWNGQKDIVLCDPNILACKDWEELLQQLIDSKARVEFNQGLDIRLMTEDKAEMLSKIKLKNVHFAFDRYQDKDIVLPKFKIFADFVGVAFLRQAVSCYVLTNFDTTWEEDLFRIYELRKLGISPYIMRYDKESIPRGDRRNKLARYVNNKRFFWKYDTFEDYLKGEGR